MARPSRKLPVALQTYVRRARSLFPLPGVDAPVPFRVQLFPLGLASNLDHCLDCLNGSVFHFCIPRCVLCQRRVILKETATLPVSCPLGSHLHLGGRSSSLLLVLHVGASSPAHSGPADLSPPHTCQVLLLPRPRTCCGLGRHLWPTLLAPPQLLDLG